jgi:hypothetical protein
MFILDFGLKRAEADCAKYQAPFDCLSEYVRPERLQNNRALYAKYWWRHVEPRPGMLSALATLPRFLTTVRVSKHRLFVWQSAPTLPDSSCFAFARDGDYFFGVLHSRFHEVWALILGTRLETRPRYTPSSCFETFPFPRSIPAYEPAIAAAAKELNDLREKWLNPPEWTAPRVLTFPGALDGPWRRFVRDADAHGIGTVHYPLTEPRDTECAAKLAKRTLTNLYNERPAWLANAHAKLDAAVAAAYGWPADLSDDRILENLLALNLARVAEEAKAARTKKPRITREKLTDEML